MSYVMLIHNTMLLSNLSRRSHTIKTKPQRQLVVVQTKRKMRENKNQFD